MNQQIPLIDVHGQFEVAALSPAQEQALAARRAADLRRQHKCRKLKRMSPAERAAYKIAEQATRLEASRAQLALGVELRHDRDDIAALQHEYFLLRTIFLGGPLAAKVFELASGDDFVQPFHKLIFDAARQVHDRGFIVTRRGIENQLKADGVTLFHSIAHLESGAADLPTGICHADIENHVARLKQA